MCDADQSRNVITNKCTNKDQYDHNRKLLCKMMNVKTCTDKSIREAIQPKEPGKRLLDPRESAVVGYKDIDVVKFQDTFNAYNCHIGQLKLFYAIFEFLIVCAQKGIDLNSCLVVYIGAAPGSNIYAVQKFFKGVTFLLYDPNSFDQRLANERNIIKTGKDGWFSTDNIPDILKYKRQLKKKNILFISDIRVNPTEDDVQRDMLMQQDTILKLKPLAYMLKFRLPYFSENMKTKYNLSSTKMFRKSTMVDPPEKQYKYLAGDMYIQLYPPPRSTETRLVGFRQRASDNAPSNHGKYNMQVYDVEKYENLLNAHNMVTRPLKKYGEDSYERSMEKHIWESYFALTKTKGNVDDAINKMDQLLNISHDKRKHCVDTTTSKHRKKLNMRKNSA